MLSVFNLPPSLLLSGQIPVGELGPEGVRRGILRKMETGLFGGWGEIERNLRFSGWAVVNWKILEWGMKAVIRPFILCCPAVMMRCVVCCSASQ